MSTNPPKTHEIVILGGNFAGLGTAHYLLRFTIPALISLAPSNTYHITVVSPSTHYYFKVGAPRALINPDLVPADKVFYPIADAFKRYAADQFTFLQGTATWLDPDIRTVHITLPATDAATSTSSSQKYTSTTTLKYDSLIIATGTTSASPLWSLNGSHTDTQAALSKMHTTLPKVKTVLIAGGGPVGIETAGEIAQNFPNTEITLLSGTHRLLSRLSTGTSQRAEQALSTAGVTVEHDLRVLNTTATLSGSTLVRLSDGAERAVDLYLDATGGRPNTSFLPAEWLDVRGKVLVSDETLRGEEPSMHGRVYAVGDCASYSSGLLVDVLFGVRPVARSLGADLARRVLAPATGDGLEKSALQEKEGPALGFGLDGKALVKALRPAKVFKVKDSQFVPIGSKGGVGQVWGFRVPSAVVWAVKARDYMVWKAQSGVDGGDYNSI